MGYESYILEKEIGLSASAIFYKKDKFKCVKKGHINLDYRPSRIMPNQYEIIGNNNRNGKYHLIYCKFDLIDQESSIDQLKTFVFAETHLKAMDDFRQARTVQTKRIK